MESKRSSPPHVVILSSPGMGHLIPLLSFSNLLLHHHQDLTMTIITYSNLSSPSQSSLLSSLPSAVSSLTIPPISLSDIPSDSRVETLISVLISRSVPHVCGILQTLKTSKNLIAYIIDLFGIDTLHVAKELCIPRYMFLTSNLFMLSFMFHLPELHRTTSCEFRELPEHLKLPGCVPLRGEDFLDPLGDRSNEAYRWVVHLAEGYKDVEGIFVNSFEALEPEAARIFSTAGGTGITPPVRLVGPVLRSGSTGRDDGFDCLGWLDRQPRGSVLFVSFGSGGTLPLDQTKELALGLEKSMKRFLWVVRTPNDSKSSGAFFESRSKSDPLDCLPEGFLERTRGSGLVVPNWVPQIEVLKHDAVGGFMTHCGWNSVLESLMNGVPMIAWPLYAEQKMNAVMLVEGVKVALRPKTSDDGLVRREAINEVVKELMSGERGKAVRCRMEDVKVAGVKAVEKGGSSYRALAEVVNKWKITCDM